MKRLGKEEWVKSEESRMEKILKVRVEINEIENERKWKLGKQKFILWKDW